VVGGASMFALGPALDDATAIWSMWEGYLDHDGALRSRLAGYGLPVHRLHASGHASREALVDFAEAVRPGVIVPIHTDRADMYSKVLGNVRIERDGDWWQV
jgi:ribonuclease J